MNKPPTHHAEQTILGSHATDALKQALRAKRQKMATLIVRRERDLHTFTPEQWIAFCVQKASSQDVQLAAAGAQYLGPIFQDISPWSAKHYDSQLKAIAGTLSDNLAHPANLTADEKAVLWSLYQALPEKYRQPADTFAPHSDIVDVVLHNDRDA